MTTDVTLSYTDPGDNDISVIIEAMSLEEDVTKSWSINAIPTPRNSRALTTTTATASAGATTITVTSTTNFRTKDVITLIGENGSGQPRTETTTIQSIAGTIFTLFDALQFTYVSGATVLKQGRVISLDFNKIIFSVTITGLLSATSGVNVEEVRNNLLTMALGGGSITLVYGTSAHANMGITKLNIKHLDTDNASITDTEIGHYRVTLNLTNSSVEIGR